MSTTKRCLNALSAEWDSLAKKNNKRTRVTLIYSPPLPPKQANKIHFGDLEITPNPPEVIVIRLDESKDKPFAPQVVRIDDDSSDEDDRDASTSEDDGEEVDRNAPTPSPTVSDWGALPNFPTPPEVIDISDDLPPDSQDPDIDPTKTFIKPMPLR